MCYVTYILIADMHCGILFLCIILCGIYQTTQGAFVRLYCNDDISLNVFKELAINASEDLILSQCFDNRRKNFFFAFGFTARVDSNTTVNMLKPIIDLGKYNTFLINWEVEASGNSTSDVITPFHRQLHSGTGYNDSAVPDSFKVGTDMGLALSRMSRRGLKLSATYVVGHSLGAQLVGQAGRTLQSTGGVIQRIIGLDPAGPGFDVPTDFPALSSNDAATVLCLHTDPGGEGTNQTRCHLDIMVNFVPFTLPDSDSRVQPGCKPDVTQMSSCSHSRAVEYFTEAIQSASMVAARAADVWDWTRGLGDCADTVELGLDWDQTKRGVYFMNTTSSSPYGLGKSGACLTV